MSFSPTAAIRRLGVPGTLCLVLVLSAAAAPARALPLEITTDTLSVATAGDAYADAFASANGTAPYTWSIVSGSLPGGITLDAGTGALSGSATIAGTSPFIVAVEDAAGDTATRALDLTVVPGAASALAFDQPPGTIVAGVPFSPAIAVSVRDAFGNLVPSAADAVSLQVTSGTGSLVGTATVNASEGVATFPGLTMEVAGTGKQLTATADGRSDAVSAAFDVTPGAAATLAFVQQPTAATAGQTIVPAVTLRVADVYDNAVADTVALSLVGNGTLSGGAPVTTDGSGIATFAALSVNREGAKRLSATTGTLGPVLSDPFTVSCPSVTLVPSSLPSGTSGTPYLQGIGANGGLAPYSFAVTQGALPAGLTLDPSGALSGTPTVSGTFGFTITATDADSCLGSLAYTLFLCPAISVLPASVPSASIGVAYSQTFTASAGTPPIGFAVTSGALPPGLSLSAGGLLSGTPAASGSFAFTVGATAADGCPGNRAYSLDVLGIPTAVTDLGANRLASGNDNDGTTKISITFTMPSGATLAEVYRAPFGHYPQYDDAGGAEPAKPSYPPGAPWTLTGVTASGQTDEPATRDFYYYVMFVKNAAGGVSAVSNQTSGACNYALGDFANGLVAGAGNNLVGTEDVSLLGANYGIGAAEIVQRGVAYLDVGPTTDLSITSRPFTDKRINFEDLVVLAANYGAVSAPQMAMKIADDAVQRAARPERFDVQAPSLVEPGQSVTAVLRMQGGGRMQAFSAALHWDATVVEPLETSSLGFLEGQGGVLLSPQPGTVDAALLGARAPGISGDGDVARFTFRVLRPGDAAIRLESVIARDAANRSLATDAVEQTTRTQVPARTLLLAPWPNPARGAATLAFALAEPGTVELALYSVEGRLVRSLASGRHEAGVHRVIWNGDDDQRRLVPPGVYYARLTAGGRRFTKWIVHIE